MKVMLPLEIVILPNTPEVLTLVAEVLQARLPSGSTPEAERKAVNFTFVLKAFKSTYVGIILSIVGGCPIVNEHDSPLYPATYNKYTYTTNSTVS